MIRKMLEYLLSLFGSKPEKQLELEKEVEKQEQKLEDIENEKNSVDDIVDHFNK